MKKKFFSILINVIIVIVVLQLVSLWKSRKLLSSGEPAPEFVLQTVNGTQYSSSTVKNKKTVLYFFSPWCTVCKRTSKSIASLRENRSYEDWEIVAIALSWSEKSEVEKYTHDYRLNIPVLYGNNEVSHKYKVAAFPTLYILDQNGKVENGIIGYFTEIGLRLRTL